MTIPMIHAGALGKIPEFIADQAGWGRVDQAFHAVGLPIDVVNQSEARIPYASVMGLIEASARCLGEQDLGLVLWRQASFTTYGTWGRYLGSAPTLRDALSRLESSICFHSPGDLLRLSRTAGGIRLTYRMSLVGSFGSDNASYWAAGALLSLIRRYLGPKWLPQLLDLSVPYRRHVDEIAERFGCDVMLGGSVISFEVPTELLDTLRPLTREPLVTLADVERARKSPPPMTLSEAVTDVLHLQLMDGRLSIDRLARTFDMGRRTLQRRLNQEGVSFRDLERRAVLERAMELLDQRDCTITEAATALCYESPGHFTRAFCRATGMSPSDYRNAKAQRALVS